MNDLLLLFILILLAAVLASRYVFRRFRSRNFFYYQTLSILIVAIISLAFNRSVSREFFEQTSPLVFLSMGWLGLYSGLFIGFQDIRRFNIRVWKYAITDSMAIFIAYFIVTMPLILAYHKNVFESFSGAVAISLAAVELSPLAVSTLRHLGRGNPSFGILLQSLSGMSGIFTIIFMGIAAPIFLSTGIGGYFLQLFYQLLLSSAVGFLSVYAIHDLRHSREFMIWIVGILLITSGLAMAFHFNAIFMNMVVGIILSTFSPRRDSARRQLEPLEKPVFLLLLLYAGLNMQLDWRLVLLSMLLIVVRVAIKVLTFRSFYGSGTVAAPGVGTLAPAVVPFGNLSFTIGIYLLILFPSDFSRVVLGVLFFQYIISFTLAGFAVHGGQGDAEP